MYISLSKTLAKFGGFRLGVGMRVTKKNSLIMALVICMASIFKAMWYILIICGWLVYIMYYGLFQLCKKSINPLKNTIKNTTNKKDGIS